MLLWGLPSHNKKQPARLQDSNDFVRNFEENVSESKEVQENVYEFAISHWLRLRPNLVQPALFMES